MSEHFAVFNAGATGYSLTAPLFAVDTTDGEILFSADSVVELGDAPGLYLATYTDVPAANYLLMALDGGEQVASWVAVFGGANGEFADIRRDVGIPNTPAGGAGGLAVAGEYTATLASIQGQVTDLLSLTETLITVVSGLSTLTEAQISSLVAAALAEIHLHRLLASQYTAGSTGVSNSLLNSLLENDGGVPRFTQHALEQATSGLSGGIPATIS